MFKLSNLIDLPQDNEPLEGGKFFRRLEESINPETQDVLFGLSISVLEITDKCKEWLDQHAFGELDDIHIDYLFGPMCKYIDLLSIMYFGFKRYLCSETWYLPEKLKAKLLSIDFENDVNFANTQV